jgi:hypothetical protein
VSRQPPRKVFARKISYFGGEAKEVIKERKKASFLKKEAKNFFKLGPCRFSASGPVKKVFAPLFSKSGCFLTFLQGDGRSERCWR